MISTRLTDRFGIKHPIVCAPMAYVTGGTLAAAVSRAGGLGIVGGGYAGTLDGNLIWKLRLLEQNQENSVLDSSPGLSREHRKC